jgi:lipopolysaccharide biosynthesis glycosyltransferase
MIVVSAADERFAPHFATMLHSAWTHNPLAHFYLLDCGIEPQTLCKLAAFAADKNIQLKTIQVDTTRFHGLPTTKFFSPAIYARLLIHELLPDVERVIYLDADTLVVCSLAPLWETPMDGAVIAGVSDPWGADEEDVTGPYVNSGVLVIDMQRWKDRQLAMFAFDYIKTHQPELPDQSAINAACADAIYLLDGNWNFRVDGRPINRRSPEEGRLAPLTQLRPRIIHFTGGYKPWLYSDVVFAELYMHHRALTPFPMQAPPRLVYRPAWRCALNMIIGRPKYWYRFLMQRRSRAFIERYLAALTGPNTLDADPLKGGA